MNKAIAPFARAAGATTSPAVPPAEGAHVQGGAPAGGAHPEGAHADGALREALLDSRRRWRDLVTMAADFVFETDAWGRLVFVAPDPVLGWPAATLLGQPAELLLVDADDGVAFNPFRITAPVRRRRAWLRRTDGTSTCLVIAAAPLFDENGTIVGVRGLGQDVTEQDIHDARIAAALRRGELLDHILWQMRQEVLAEKMMKSALEALVSALGADGCAVIDMLGDGVASSVLYQVGVLTPDMLHTAMTLLEAGAAEPSQASEPAQASDPEGRRILVCPSQQRYGEQAGFALWRPPGARAWDGDELALAGSATGIIRVILEHEAIQREMARQARTDPLTGLLNRRAFLDEVSRRVERLEREELPGTLMFIDLDNFKALNDFRGHDVGDEALCLTAALLRKTVRPSDLVARLGGDEFAIWMDGADELTAAERAESLRVECPRTLAHLAEGYDLTMTMSIGIAARWPGQGEDIESLIHRADQVMYEVKRAGRGHWRVSRIERV